MKDIKRAKKPRRMSAEKKEKKTKGTIMAEETRAKANGLADAQREQLLNRAMQLIYQNGHNTEVRVNSR